ncbi:MAG: hypothetical protein RR054_04070, partial [Clostridia bacterium]
TADPYKTDLMYLYYLKEITILNNLSLQLPTKIITSTSASINITWILISNTITNGVNCIIDNNRLTINFTAPQPDLITGTIQIQAEIKNGTSVVAIRIFTIDVNIKKQP